MTRKKNKIRVPSDPGRKYQWRRTGKRGFMEINKQ